MNNLTKYLRGPDRESYSSLVHSRISSLRLLRGKTVSIGSSKAWSARRGEPMLGPPTLGPLPDALESFMRVTERWLSVGPTITRIAFGAVLFISVKDLASAYQELSRFLPTVELGGTDSPDFLYQINRPRASKSLPEIRVNRMTKWSVIQGESISIGFRAGGGSVLASASPELACRLELDINTVPESMTSTHQARIQPLFNELVELGSEIAEKGDIP